MAFFLDLLGSLLLCAGVLTLFGMFLAGGATVMVEGAAIASLGFGGLNMGAAALLRRVDRLIKIAGETKPGS